MEDIENLEEQCETIQEKLNSHGFMIANASFSLILGTYEIISRFQVLTDFHSYDFEDSNNEDDFKNTKALITQAINELSEEKGRLASLNNDASKLSSNLMSAERELSDEMKKLEERSEYLAMKIRTANQEYEAAEKEMQQVCFLSYCQKRQITSTKFACCREKQPLLPCSSLISFFRQFQNHRPDPGSNPGPGQWNSAVLTQKSFYWRSHKKVQKFVTLKNTSGQYCFVKKELL